MAKSFFLNEDVSYAFNDDGKLVNVKTAEGFVFTNQDDYNRLGDYVTEYVYDLLTKAPYSLRRVSITGKDVTNSPNSQDEKESFVFISENFWTAKTIVVLIHGTGVVRAGQWTRKYIINDSLEVGTQLPYIQECHKQGFGILVMNTNDTYYMDENNTRIPKEDSNTSIIHGRTVWQRFIEKQCALHKIIIIAHSYGGVVTADILRSTTLDIKRIAAICLTDAICEDPTFFIKKLPFRNWVRSDRPLDAEINAECGTVSAGTDIHELTSHMAIKSIFDFIELSL